MLCTTGTPVKQTGWRTTLLSAVGRVATAHLRPMLVKKGRVLLLLKASVIHQRQVVMDSPFRCLHPLGHQLQLNHPQPVYTLMFPQPDGQLSPVSPIFVMPY
ncbi:hypothetical protein LSM04_001495 [Trypanosoma melophagium]|uniref:uncharacterized protein n=1 Tax=Trypanosoma melophagium TaxID=715481 RepID=UPI00351AB0C2|nr:hypothetical protein LSM04_001495 [Trypanosoma melophagium]